MLITYSYLFYCFNFMVKFILKFYVLELILIMLIF